MSIVLAILSKLFQSRGINDFESTLYMGPTILQSRHPFIFKIFTKDKT